MLEAFVDSKYFLLSVFITLVITVLTLKNIYRRRKLSDMHKKHVLITGCDSGFGREIAIRLDEMGAYVLATCLTKEGEQNLKSVTSDKAKTFLMDVTDSQQVKMVFQRVRELLPPEEGLWGLVNNAGIVVFGPIEWIPLDKMKRVVDVNLWGMIDVTKTFMPLLKKARGRVVNMSSMLGRFSLPLVTVYCISKYGVEAFSDGLRREMSPWGVLVSMIEPGLYRTGLTSADPVVRSIQEMWNGLSEELKEEYGEKQLNRVKRAAIKASKSASPDSFKVVDAVVDALTSLRPKTHYVVGFGAKVSNVLALLPATISDHVLRMKALRE